MKIVVFGETEMAGSEVDAGHLRFPKGAVFSTTLRLSVQKAILLTVVILQATKYQASQDKRP